MSRFELVDSKTRSEKFRDLCALGIMTKAPQPGKVKTRLTPPLSPVEAAELNACFLRDLSHSIHLATNQARACGVAIYTPIGHESVYENILPPDFLLIPQRGESFGSRLNFATADLLAAGFESVCLINSDSPTVPAATFAEAANELGQTGDKVVLGPSNDGGYYLIGLKQVHERVFEDIEWSTERVFEQTIERVKELGLRLHLLASGLDVDDETSLHQLCDELLCEDSPPGTAPHTRTFLQNTLKRESRDQIGSKKL
jgi:uncharacterized protein